MTINLCNLLAIGGQRSW